jgi:hypothetical protein
MILILALPSAACGKKAPPAEIYDPGHGIDKNTVVDDIASDGESDYVIIVPSDAGAAVLYAADELKSYVASSSGARLDIYSESDFTGNAKSKFISLGKTDLYYEMGFGYDLGKLNYDGFVMRTKNSALFIAGQRDSGVLYGVYDFCEQVLDIKFLTAEAVIVPPKSAIPLYSIDRTEIPAFSNREYFAYQAMNDKEFSSKLRMNSGYGLSPDIYGEGGGNLYYTGDGHTLPEMFPYADYGAEHADWYTENGREFEYTSGITEDGDFDPSEPNSFAHAVLAYMKEKITANTAAGARYFMLGQPDDGSWSNSEKTRKSDVKYGGPSGTLMVFINAIAAEIEKWQKVEKIDKEVNIATFAYWKTLTPPVTTDGGQILPKHEKVVARDNVIVKIAHMSCGYHALTDTECSVNNTFRGVFSGWHAVAKRLTVWDYATNFDDHFFWYPNFGSLSQNYKYYRSIGVETVMTQGAPHVGNYYQAHLENYIIAKLLWNPELDVNALVGDFNLHYFGGESAPVVDSFVSSMNYHFAGLEDFHTELYSLSDFKSFEKYPVGLLEGLIEKLEDEIASVKSRDSLTADEKTALESRLTGVLIHPQYMLLKNYDAYYDPSGKRDFALKFFKNTDSLNIRYYGENASIQSLKGSLGIS